MENNNTNQQNEQEKPDAQADEYTERIKTAYERIMRLDPEDRKLLLYLFEVFERELDRALAKQNAAKLYAAENNRSGGGK